MHLGLGAPWTGSLLFKQPDCHLGKGMPWPGTGGQEAVTVQVPGLSQPGGGSISCEKCQVPAWSWCWAAAACTLAEPAGWPCQAAGLALQHLSSSAAMLRALLCRGHSALVGMQLVTPSKSSCPVFPVSAPKQDQNCTFSPCSSRENHA